jgi:hypothetical protein
MNWLKVNEFVEAWAAEKQLPADLTGKTLTLVEFGSDSDCRFFYPERTQHAQQVFITALARFARSRHARTEHRSITPDHYLAWLAGEKAGDSPETRGLFIESRYQVLPNH